MKSFARKPALCGVLGALAIVLMLMGGIIPFATFCAPAIAGILIFPATVEFGHKTGILMFLSISLLSGFLLPDKEMAMIFVFFLGYYPILKIALEKIKNIFLRVIVKLGIFNISIVIMYSLLIFVFKIDFLTDELKTSSTVFMILLFAMANFTFIIYDFAVKRLVAVYCSYIRPKIIKMH